MIKYTANYTYTNPNFVIQNLEYKKSESDLLPLIYVLKNILQRGYPTVMSKYLQDKVGDIHNRPDFEDRLLFVPSSINIWNDTIKGGEGYNPAKDFYERLIPQELGEYSFIQPMILPEVGINEIVGQYNPEFVDQQVDFYLPQAKLCIEIDGGQHSISWALDAKRNTYLEKYGIETIRISTHELQENKYKSKLEKIVQRIERYKTKGAFPFYRKAFEKAKNNSYTEDEVHYKMLPTAIIRFQLLLLDLLAYEYIKCGELWKFNIKCEEPIEDFAKLAIEDIYVWLNQLYKLRNKKELPKFDYNITVSNGRYFTFDTHAINIDFSLRKRYTDEAKANPDIIYVRSDYYDYSSKRNLIGLDKNYFEVSTAKSINYKITDSDRPTLLFFLQNLFGKRDFRDGQFPIIANALNLQDTIGLLPTGGGKSLCFQMPCLLQPSVNFVVCPIKSLMYDQIDNLNRKDVSITNINLICGDQSTNERANIMRGFSEGKYLFVWISPERFQIPEFRESIKAIINSYNITYAVIDEVHCLSEWGHDFRTSYLNLAKTIDNLSPRDDCGEGTIKYIGLTATASVNVLKDIKIEFSRRTQQLDDINIKTLIEYTRPELDFIVVNDGNQKYGRLTALFKNNNIPNNEEQATLVFTPHVNGDNGCYQLANNLNRDYPDKVAWYSGRCPDMPGNYGHPIMSQNNFDDYKRTIQEDFKNDRYKVLCATKAFGMGVDKQNIFFTFHYGLPSSVEALYQEAGRAGRWDNSLPENKDKRGNCYVLLSPETPAIKQTINQQVFAPSTDIGTMKATVKNIGNNGRDVTRQLSLFLFEMFDIQTEFANILQIVQNFFQEGITLNISYNQINQIGLSANSFEKAIYRLCLLGVADDWTRDFKSIFSVKFNSTNDEHIIQSLQNYILKYDPDEDIEEGINNITVNGCTTFLEKALWYLLDWIFQNITRNRIESLKTLSDWCLDYKDSNSFKQRLESYFTFNESTYILQHIAEHPTDYAQWFEAFYSNEQFITETEIAQLRDRIRRFLESNHNNGGLNFVSGMVRLMLNEFEDSDGRQRMENALKYVHDKNLESLEDNAFVNGIVKFLKDAPLTDEQRTEICEMIENHFPHLKSVFIEEYDMPWLDNPSIENNIKTLITLKKKLYEQIKGIQ